MALLHLEPLAPRVRRGDVLRFICEAGGISGALVGRIELRGAIAVVEVPAQWLVRLVKSLDGASMGERRLHARAVTAANAVNENDHFARLARCLALEADAEVERITSNAASEKRDKSLAGLVVAGEDSGLGGRWIVSFARRNRAQPLPWNRMEPGTPVLVSPEGADEAWRGVVCERDKFALSVALDEPPEATDPFKSFAIHKSADQTSRQRQTAALDRARSATRDRLAELRGILLGEKTPEFAAVEPVAVLDAGLNESQKDAISLALAAKDVAIIHGPPGTGKTTAVVELIRQAVRRGQKVLACAPSNIAVDNMLERLLVHGEKAIRLGHPARVLEPLRERTLDVLALGHPDTRQARKLFKQAFALFRQAGKYTRAKPEPGARQQMRTEARALLTDARKMEAQAVESILNQATIVCATLTGLDSEILGQRQFDLAVIDEAGQSTESACWLPLLRANKVILAGDHFQLPPTILSQDAVAAGFGVSLLERLAELFGPLATRRLQTQYRMHQQIMEFSSLQFYEADLTAHDSVAGHLLRDLVGVADVELTGTAVEFVDTAGAGYDEEGEPDGSSRQNPQEAHAVGRKVKQLIDAGVSPTMIAVIAPYAAQVRLLRLQLDIPGLEIDSVDGFQGREKEAVVLSMVRSNPEGEVGFLADVRRMNVAMTRARRKLIVIGDSATLSCHPFYRDLLTYFETIGAYGSIWEEND